MFFRDVTFDEYSEVCKTSFLPKLNTTEDGIDTANQSLSDCYEKLDTDDSTVEAKTAMSSFTTESNLGDLESSRTEFNLSDLESLSDNLENKELESGVRKSKRVKIHTNKLTLNPKEKSYVNVLSEHETPETI